MFFVKYGIWNKFFIKLPSEKLRRDASREDSPPSKIFPFKFLELKVKKKNAYQFLDPGMARSEKN
jgi:hypothetical protein